MISDFDHRIDLIMWVDHDAPLSPSSYKPLTPGRYLVTCGHHCRYAEVRDNSFTLIDDGTATKHLGQLYMHSLGDLIAFGGLDVSIWQIVPRKRFLQWTS